MRIRSIKPEFWTDERVAAWDVFTRLCFIGLWSFADDHGRGIANPVLVAANLFPYDMSRDARETLASVSKAFDTLSNERRIIIYKSAGIAYYAVTNWKRHQRVDKIGKSRIPEPENLTDLHSNTYETVESDSRESRESFASIHEKLPAGAEEQRSRGTEEQRSRGGEETPATPAPSDSESKAKRNPKRGGCTPPTLAEWTTYCAQELKWPDLREIKKAWAYYQGVGWVIGKGKAMKDWHAIALAWQARADGYADERAEGRKERDGRIRPSAPQQQDKPPPMLFDDDPRFVTPSPEVAQEVAS